MKRHPIGIYLLCAISVGYVSAQNGYQYENPNAKSLPLVSSGTFANGNGNQNKQNGYQKQNNFGLRTGYQNGAQTNGYQNYKKSNGYQNGQLSNGYQDSKKSNGYQNGQLSNGYQNSQLSNGYQDSTKKSNGFQNGNYNSYQEPKKTNGYQDSQPSNGYQQEPKKTNGYQNGQSNGYQQESKKTNGYQNGQLSNGYQNGKKNNGYQNGGQFSNGNGYQYKRPQISFDSSTSTPGTSSFSTSALTSQTPGFQQTFQPGGETTIQESFQPTFTTSEAPSFSVTNGNGNGIAKQSNGNGLSQTFATFSQEVTTFSPVNTGYGDTSSSDLNSFSQGSSFYGGVVTQETGETTPSPASSEGFNGGTNNFNTGSTGSEESNGFTPTSSAPAFGNGNGAGSSSFVPTAQNSFTTGGTSVSPNGFISNNLSPQKPANYNGGNTVTNNFMSSLVGAQGTFTPSQNGQSAPFPGNVARTGSTNFNAKQTYDSDDGDYSAIPGKPDTDYPILSEIIRTSFSCAAQKSPGYYADVEARCQVFHVCNNGLQYDFLCPNGTIFSQMHLVCVWWNQFDCASATSLYSLNEEKFQESKARESPPGLTEQGTFGFGEAKQQGYGGAPLGTQSTDGGFSYSGPGGVTTSNGVQQTRVTDQPFSTGKPSPIPSGPSSPYDGSSKATSKSNEDNLDASVDTYSNYETPSTVSQNYPYQPSFNAPNREYLPPYGKR